MSNTTNTLEPGKTTSRQASAVLLLISTAVLWSLAGVLIKTIQWHPFAIAGGRSAIAALVIGVYVRFFSGQSLVPQFSLPFVGATILYTATVTLFVTATKMTSAANAIVLQYTAPIYVAIFGSIFLGERVTRRDIITMVGVISGVALFFADYTTVDRLLGIGVALLSGVSMAGMAICLRLQARTTTELTNGNTALQSLVWGNILTALCGTPFIIMHGLPDSSDLLWVVVLGVVQLGIPYILYAHALQRSTALEAVLITMLEPILNPLWVALAIQEFPNGWSLVGAGIVIVVILVRSVVTLRK